MVGQEEPPGRTRGNSSRVRHNLLVGHEQPPGRINKGRTAVVKTRRTPR